MRFYPVLQTHSSLYTSNIWLSFRYVTHVGCYKALVEQYSLKSVKNIFKATRYILVIRNHNSIEASE